ncbi:MAG TPA: glycosyltransferase [Actinomycetota bacterium]
MNRILHLIKGLGRGGAEQLLLSEAPYLDRARFDYRVAYLLPEKDALVPELEAAGVPAICLDGSSGFAWVARLRALVRGQGIDLIHSHSPVAAVGARLAFPGRRRPRRVYTEHNVWERYHRLTYWANRLTFPRSDHVFAVSDHVRDSLHVRDGTPPVETLYHGIDPAVVSTWVAPNGIRDELGIPADAPVVGTVANFKAHKGYDVLLRAALRVREEVPDVRFVSVGRGPLEASVRRQAQHLGLDGTVVFAGFRDDAPRVAATFDLFTMASVHEGLSIALIEALALGKPAVVTEVGGLPEVVQHGRQGFLVPPANPEALAAAIVRLLRDPALRFLFGDAARRRAADFDIRRAVRRYEDLYGEILA